MQSYSGAGAAGAGVANFEGARSHPVSAQPFAAGTGSFQIMGGDALVVGLTAIETTGSAPAVFELRDSGDANGTLVAVVSLSAGQSIREKFPDPGVLFKVSVFLNVVSGSIRGSVWIRDV